jgi:hypothetical protein
MKSVLSALMISAVMFVCAGCTLSDKDAPFRNNSVIVASCPADIRVNVNGEACVTPCNLKFPGSTTALTVKYGDKTTVVPVEQSNLHAYQLAGTLFILNPENIGKGSDAPDTTYFLRDTDLGMTVPCAAH